MNYDYTLHNTNIDYGIVINKAKILISNAFANKKVKRNAFFRSVIPVIISQFLRHISHKITYDTLFFGYT